ncbi:MAG: hypothetical protein GX864_01565 [Mollicutes bacterium]|nr:hypothetical protein [Mollicutes bacterium]
MAKNKKEELKKAKEEIKNLKEEIDNELPKKKDEKTTKSIPIVAFSSDELISEKEKRKLIRKEKRSDGFNNFFSKLVSFVFTILVLCWVVICLVDFFKVQDGHKPSFCLRNEVVEVAVSGQKAGKIDKCVGLGYKVLRFDKYDGCNTKMIYGPFWLKDECPHLK